MNKFFTQLRRNKWKLAGLALVGFGGTILVAPIRALTWEPAASALIERGAAQFLGGEANVESLRWRVGGLELGRLEWTAAEGGDRVLLDTVRVEAAWSRVLRGDVSALESVAAERVDLVWTVLAGTEADEAEPASAGAPAPPELGLLRLPNWSIGQAHIDIHGPEWRVLLGGLATSHADGVLALNAPEFEFVSGEKAVLSGPLIVKGTLAPDAWEFTELRAGSQLAGRFNVAQDEAGSIAGAVELGWEQARIELELDWTDAALAATFLLVPIELKNVPSLVGLPDDCAGVVDLRGHGVWSSDAPWIDAELDVAFDLRDGVFGDVKLPLVELRADARAGVWNARATAPGVFLSTLFPALDASLGLEWKNGLVRVFDSRVDCPDGTHVTLDGNVPFALGGVEAIGSAPIEFDLNARVPELQSLAGADYRGALKIAATITGTVNSPLADLTATVEHARFQDYPEGTVDLHARAEDALEIDVLNVDLPGFAELHGTARVGLSTDFASWQEDARVEADLSLLFPDLGKIPLQSSALRRVAGRLAAQAEVGGTLANPTCAATAEVSGGRVDFVGEIPSTTDLELKLLATTTEVRIVSGSGAMGGGPFEFTGAYSVGGDAPHCTLELSGENVLFARSRESLLRGDMDLRVAGPIEELAVDGKLHITSGLVATRVEFDSLLAEGRPATSEEGLSLFSLTDAPLSDMRFNVEITSARSIGLESNVVKARIRPDLVLRGTGEVPELNGVVYIDSASLSLPASTLRVTSGTVRFDPANPFVPDLAIEGGTKMLGFEVSMIVSGPMDEPEVALSASPTMASEDILVLILTGQLPAEIGTRGGRSDTGQSVALYFGKDLLAKWFASDDPLSDEETLLDRLEFYSGQDVSRQGTPTLEASYRLRKEFIRADDRLVLRLERDVWEDYNLGVRWVVRLR